MPFVYTVHDMHCSVTFHTMLQNAVKWS